MTAAINNNGVEQMEGSPLDLLNLFQAERSHPFLKNIDTFFSRYLTVGNLYDPKHFDTALANSQANARAMRNDAFIESLLLERHAPLPVAPWSIVASDDQYQEDADFVTGLVEKLTGWSQLVSYLAEADWHGKYGSLLSWEWDSHQGNDVYIPLRHQPLHGDKIAFDWDGVPGILIGSEVMSKYPSGDVFTSILGPCLKLRNPSDRAQVIIHKHKVIDSDYYMPQQGMRVHGYGLRSPAYWCWNLRNEVLGWAMQLMSRVGLTGILIFWYLEGSKDGQADAERASQQVKTKNTLVMSRTETTNLRGESWGVQHIPVSMQGLDALMRLIDDYYQKNLERLIVGQGMSGGQDADNGLGGSGRAKFAKSTKDNNTKYDLSVLAETLTSDLVTPICRLNRPNAVGHLKLTFPLPDDDENSKREGVQFVLSAGLPVAEKDVYNAGGVRKPKEVEKSIGGQQQQPQQAGQQQPVQQTPEVQAATTQTPELPQHAPEHWVDEGIFQPYASDAPEHWVDETIFIPYVEGQQAEPRVGKPEKRVVYGEGEKQIAQRLFRRELTHDEMHGLGGGHHESDVTLHGDHDYDETHYLEIQSESPHHVADLTVHNQDGSLKADYGFIRMHPHAKGGTLAPTILANQMRMLHALGVHQVSALAARQDDRKGMIGYKVWPKMGFDGPLTSKHLAKLPEEFQTAKTIQGLLAMPGGKEAWDKFGDSIKVSIDLRSAAGQKMMQHAERVAKRAERQPIYNREATPKVQDQSLSGWQSVDSGHSHAQSPVTSNESRVANAYALALSGIFQHERSPLQGLRNEVQSSGGDLNAIQQRAFRVFEERFRNHPRPELASFDDVSRLFSDAWKESVAHVASTQNARTTRAEQFIRGSQGPLAKLRSSYQGTQTDEVERRAFEIFHREYQQWQHPDLAVAEDFNQSFARAWRSAVHEMEGARSGGGQQQKPSQPQGGWWSRVRRWLGYDTADQIAYDQDDPIEYASEGQWVTIGGVEGEDGKRRGGSPAFIKDGRIAKGHPSMIGKKPSELGDKESQGKAYGVRKANQHQREYDRAKIVKEARQQGLDVRGLHSLAEDVLDHNQEQSNRWTKMLQDARRIYEGLGYGSLQGMKARNARGTLDAAGVRGLDDVAARIQEQHPGMIPSDVDAADYLYDALVQGNRQPMTEAEAYQIAFDMLMENHQKKPTTADDDDFVPFAEVYNGSA